MRLWLLMIGLLIIGMIAPFYAATAGDVVGLYSDTTTQVVIWAVLPVVLIVFVYMMLFYEG